jgi:hypothetical protein
MNTSDNVAPTPSNDNQRAVIHRRAANTLPKGNSYTELRISHSRRSPHALEGPKGRICSKTVENVSHPEVPEIPPHGAQTGTLPQIVAALAQIWRFRT